MPRMTEAREASSPELLLQAVRGSQVKRPFVPESQRGNIPLGWLSRIEMRVRVWTKLITHHRVTSCPWLRNSTSVDFTSETQAYCFPGTVQMAGTTHTGVGPPGTAQRGRVLNGSFRPSFYPLAKVEGAPSGGSRPSSNSWVWCVASSRQRHRGEPGWGWEPGEQEVLILICRWGN